MDFYDFIDFREFLWFFVDLVAESLPACAGLKAQPAAPTEIFARFQLPAIIDSLMLVAGWPAGWLAGWVAGDDWLLLGGMED